MASPVGRYVPNKVLLNLFGISITGFEKGTFIKITRKTDRFSDDVGPMGDVVRVESSDERAELEFTLQSTSPSNALLYAQVDRPDGTDIGAFQMKDLNTSLICSGPEAWLMRPADFEASDTHTPRVWKAMIPHCKFEVNG